MVADMRERGKSALELLSEHQLRAVVCWLELLAELNEKPDIEPEELWLLATGELKNMDDEMKDAEPLEDYWALTPQQMLFLMQNHNAIEAAYMNDNVAFLRRFADTPEFRATFGRMGFDEAYDRYETMLDLA